MNFDIYHNREKEGSVKWHLMREKKPTVGDDIIPMTVADMDFETDQAIKDGLCKYINETILGYTLATDEYLDTIVDYYEKNFKTTIKKEHIVTSAGIVPAIFSCLRAFTNENDGIMIFTPVYPQFSNAIKQTNRTLVACPLVYEDNQYFIDFELFEQLAKKEENKLLIFCNPHNPSGRIWTKEELARLDDICKANDIIVLSDEIHSDLMLYGNEHNPYFCISDHSCRNSVLMSAASKSFNIAGLKCANLVIKDPNLRDKYQAQMASQGIMGANMIGMKATELAYKYSRPWLKEVIKTIEHNFGLLKEFFGNYGDLFALYDSQATYLAWVNYRKFAEKVGITSEEIYDFLEDYDIFVHHGINFGEEGEYFMRINIGMPPHKCSEFLERFKKGLKERYDI
ncbi:MAG: putative C-S lyase [Tissierellia bacterium]|nr:putative C-S lyase [Tissierellia bacterium]